MSNSTPPHEIQNSETKTLQVVVNGDSRSIPAGLNVLGLLKEFGIAPERVAVELNRRIVRQPDWEATPVESGAQLEIVQFVGGG